MSSGAGELRRAELSRRTFARLSLAAAAGVPLLHACAGSSRAGLGDKDSARTFLQNQARRAVESALVRSGRDSGPYHNSTPYDIRVPGGNMGYPAFWVRDAAMMLGGELVSAEEVEGWIRLVCSTLVGPGDRAIRDGVVVPAYCVPDHINFDGRATFYPGNYETGERQGGAPWGKYPPLDDGFYFLQMVHEHWRLTGSTKLLRVKVATSFGSEMVGDLCERVYGAVKSEAGSGLVVAGDPDSENAKDWGFCDSVFKSGKLLFPSVLKFVAARRLAEMFSACGDATKAQRYRNEARLIGVAIAAAFLRESKNGKEALLHSASGVGDQPDVWGSALAVHCGALDERLSAKVSRALVRAYRDRTAVRDGAARQVPTSDRLGGVWERSISAAGTYQNGGYWGTPMGWYISAVYKTDRAAAADMAREFVRGLGRKVLEDGAVEAVEWFNPDTGASANPRYVATVALPYLGLREAGILELLDFPIREVLPGERGQPLR